jgi:hypothetical protein
MPSSFPTDSLPAVSLSLPSFRSATPPVVGATVTLDRPTFSAAPLPAPLPFRLPDLAAPSFLSVPDSLPLSLDPATFSRASTPSPIPFSSGPQTIADTVRAHIAARGIWGFDSVDWFDVPARLDPADDIIFQLSDVPKSSLLVALGDVLVSSPDGSEVVRPLTLDGDVLRLTLDFNKHNKSKCRTRCGHRRSDFPASPADISSYSIPPDSLPYDAMRAANTALDQATRVAGLEVGITHIQNRTFVYFWDRSHENGGRQMTEITHLS